MNEETYEWKVRHPAEPLRLSPCCSLSTQCTVYASTSMSYPTTTLWWPRNLHDSQEAGLPILRPPHYSRSSHVGRNPLKTEISWHISQPGFWITCQGYKWSRPDVDKEPQAGTLGEEGRWGLQEQEESLAWYQPRPLRACGTFWLFSALVLGSVYRITIFFRIGGAGKIDQNV